MELHEASENYLEAILMISEKQPKVRAVDICNFLGFAKSTVSVAMKKLRENGYITISEEGSILLTEKGNEIAQKIYERHVILAKFFMLLGVDEKTAYEDSCRIEHDISEKTFAVLKELYFEEKQRRINQ